MKKMFFSALVAALLLASPLVRAEGLDGVPDLGSTSASARPPVAGEGEVAMIYWMLARETPKFEAMAKQTDEYKKATSFDRDNVVAAKVAEMKGYYESVNFGRPIVVRMLVHLSPYSEKNSGFVITDFEDQTFFKYSYAGDNYAIVPRGLMDHQFLGPITDPAMIKKIQDVSFHNGKAFHLMVYLKPDYADSPKTLTEVDNQRYHIISGAVSHVSLFDVKETQQLWGDNSDEYNTEQHNDLMKLKQ